MARQLSRALLAEYQDNLSRARYPEAGARAEGAVVPRLLARGE